VHIPFTHVNGILTAELSGLDFCGDEQNKGTTEHGPLLHCECVIFTKLTQVRMYLILNQVEFESCTGVQSNDL
jgi:hypothetical protein